MFGILILVVILAAIVASLLHISAGWALILVVGGGVAFAIVKARQPATERRTGKVGVLFSNVCPGCGRHNKTSARVCAHCSTPLVEKIPEPAEATKVCPDCAETVLANARICRYCKHEFSPAAAPST